MDQTTTMLFFFAAIFIFAGIIIATLAIIKRPTKQLNQDKYRSQWLKIETGLNKNDSNSFTISILNADKLLDLALKEKGIAGKVMAARMKQFQGKWSNGNGLWAAHKLRNRLVHETDATVDYNRAKQALLAFKQGLKDVGAI